MARWLLSTIEDRDPIIDCRVSDILGDHGQPQHTRDTFNSDKVLFLIGAPRSGTTWLAKIFDSHPNVILRNEPDVLLWNDRIPIICNERDCHLYRSVARRYVRDLLNVRGLKAAGVPPIFRKSFHRAASHWVHLGAIYAVQFADLLSRHSKYVSRMPIPDLIDNRAPAPRVVIKSVSTRGRAKLFLGAMPSSKAILILRHPCAQVASVLRGIALGKITDPSGWLNEALATNEATELGLMDEKFERLTLPQKLAWHWALMNQCAMNDLRGLPRARIVRYEDIVGEPENRVRELLTFADLEWSSQTAAFLHRSTTYKGRARYFSVWRDTDTVAERWKDDVPAHAQAQVMQIVKQLPVGRLYG